MIEQCETERATVTLPLATCLLSRRLRECREPDWFAQTILPGAYCSISCATAAFDTTSTALASSSHQWYRSARISCTASVSAPSTSPTVTRSYCSTRRPTKPGTHEARPTGPSYETHGDVGFIKEEIQGEAQRRERRSCQCWSNCRPKLLPRCRTGDSSDDTSAALALGVTKEAKGRFWRRRVGKFEEELEGEGGGPAAAACGHGQCVKLVRWRCTWRLFVLLRCLTVLDWIWCILFLLYLSMGPSSVDYTHVLPIVSFLSVHCLGLQPACDRPTDASRVLIRTLQDSQLSLILGTSCSLRFLAERTRYCDAHRRGQCGAMTRHAARMGNAVHIPSLPYRIERSQHAKNIISDSTIVLTCADCSTSTYACWLGWKV